MYFAYFFYLQANFDISNSKGMGKHFELSEVRDKQIKTSSEFKYMYNMFTFVKSLWNLKNRIEKKCQEKLFLFDLSTFPIKIQQNKLIGTYESNNVHCQSSTSLKKKKNNLCRKRIAKIPAL